MSCIQFNPFTGNFDFVGNGASTPGTSTDHHSGYNEIITGETITIEARKQMINFGGLTLDGTLNLNGDLWLV